MTLRPIRMPHRSTAAHGRLSRGFTIVELMVVTGIIAILMGLLVVGLTGIRRTGQKTEESNNLHQVGIAWTLYANNNNDAALPGYLTPEVQQRWEIAYDFPDKTDIPPAPNFSAGDPNIAGPWVWRLLGYLDFNHDVIHSYTEEDDASVTAMMDEAEELSLQPAFGYNGYYVGGYWEVIDVNGSPTARARFRPQTSALPPGERRVSIPITISQISKSSDLIVFCSSSEYEPGVYIKQPNDRPGHHLVVPPYLANEQQWTSGRATVVGGGGGQVAADVASDPRAIQTFTTTSAPMGRFNGMAVYLRADGSTAKNNPGALMDMRLWINEAPDANWQHLP